MLSKSQEQKLVISSMSALIFFVVANPETFQAVRKIFGSWVSSPTGCPTIRGLTLHALVFLLVVWGLMNIRREGLDGAALEEAANKAANKVAGQARDATDAAGKAAAAAAKEAAAAAAAEEEAKKAAGGGDDDGDDDDSDIDVNVNVMPGVPGAGAAMGGMDIMDSKNDGIAPYQENGADSDDDDDESPGMIVPSMSNKMGKPMENPKMGEKGVKMGDYMECKCGDGSRITMLK